MGHLASRRLVLEEPGGASGRRDRAGVGEDALGDVDELAGVSPLSGAAARGARVSVTSALAAAAAHKSD
jgi:hypothetical protein